MPQLHHKNLRSTNMVERLMEELKRRTLAVRIFPSACHFAYYLAQKKKTAATTRFSNPDAEEPSGRSA